MKNVLNLKSSIAVLTMVLSLVGFTNVVDRAESDEKATNPVGVWVCEIESPDGTINSKMTISQNEKKQYKVTVATNEYGTLELADIEFKDDVMEGNVEVAGGVADFELEFDGDSVEGTIYFGEDELPLTGERETGK